MMTEHYDVAVLGLGGMGSATIYQLARRGVRVCGIERFGIAHVLGSSHGTTRIIRKAYFEHPDYLPLLDRAYALWRDFESESGARLFFDRELILSGTADSPVIKGLASCYAQHDLPHERLDATTAQQRFPHFRFPADHVVYVDPTAGYLLVERGVESFITAAQKHGARVLIHEDALKWHAVGSSISITTAQREIRAERLIICAGPWASEILAELAVPIIVRRKVQMWFRPIPAAMIPAALLPIYYFDMGYGQFYGFPALDPAGIKVAQHDGGDSVADPDEVTRRLTSNDEAPLDRFVNGMFPGFGLEPGQFSVCMYSMTPDEHFIVDRHPAHDNVILAAGFSGHGYKFAPVMGEILSDLATTGTTNMPIGFLALDRAELRTAH